MPIQWTQNLLLGVPELDEQHLELDGHLALVHDAICEGRVPDVAAVLAGVRSCSARHFACEEAFMARSGCPALPEHRARHREFTEQLARLEEASRREGATMPLAIEVGNSLARWLREHQRYDLQLKAYVRQPQPRAPGETGP